MLFWLILLLAILGGLFALLGGEPGALAALDADSRVWLVISASLIGVYILFLAGDYRGRALQALKHLGLWTLVFVAILVGYSYRGDLANVAHRVAGDLLPPGQATVVETENGERAVRIRRRPDGHFIARAGVNGTALNMLVDTGATTVVLKPADAERAGIDIKTLTFSVPVKTANGIAYAAPVRLKAISLGGIDIRGVEALVAKPGSLNENLLGMSFLSRLRSYEFSGDFLTLRG